MYANVTGLSLGIGMASGLDTICAQAHTGSNDPHALGKHLQRGYVVMLFLTFPVFAFWFYAETILIFAGQDPAIASLAGTYLLYLLPGVIPYFIYEW